MATTEVEEGRVRRWRRQRVEISVVTTPANTGVCEASRSSLAQIGGAQEGGSGGAVVLVADQQLGRSGTTREGTSDLVWI